MSIRQRGEDMSFVLSTPKSEIGVEVETMVAPNAIHKEHDAAKDASECYLPFISLQVER